MSNSTLRHTHAWLAPDRLTAEDLNDVSATFRQVADSLGLRSINIWTGRDDHRNAVSFGSNDYREHAILQLRLFGEAVGVGNHRFTQHFSDVDQSYEREWIEGAKSLLADQAIRYTDTKIENGKHAFLFNKLSDFAYFASLSYSGHFDALVQEPLLPVPLRQADFFTPPRSKLG